MNKFIKVSLITAVILMVVGLVAGGIVTVVAGRNFLSMATDSSNSFEWNFGIFGGNSDRDLGRRLEQNLNRINPFSDRDLTVNGDLAKDGTYRNAGISAEGITELDITVGIGEFQIVPWDDDSFAIEISGIGRCRYQIMGNILSVEGFDVAGWSNNMGATNKLNLYVPDSLVFEEIDIEVGVGAVKMRGLSAKKLSGESGVGSLSMSDMDVDYLEISAGVGDAIFAGAVNSRVDANCGVGSIALKLAGVKEDFNYQLDCAMGSISLGNDSFSGFSSTRAIDNEAGKRMNLECAIGEIKVSFY